MIFYRFAVSNSHERQNAVSIRVCRRFIAVLSTKNANQQSMSTHTRRKRNVAAALLLWVLNCSWLLDGHCQCRHLIVVVVDSRFLVSLVDCRLQSTWACIQLQLAVDFGDAKRKYERWINCKIVANMPCKLSLRGC